jgi:hypothetical protein
MIALPTGEHELRSQLSNTNFWIDETIVARPHRHLTILSAIIVPASDPFFA